MLRKFITNLSLLVLLNLLIKPIYIFGIDRAVQVSLGAEEYGVYFALFNFTFLFNILLDFGITNFNNRNISQNQQLIGKHYSNLFTLRFLLGGLYFIVGYTLAWFLGYEYGALELLCWLMLNQFFISMVSYNRSNLAGLHLFVSDSIVSVLDRSILIILCGVVIYTNITGIVLDIMNFVQFQTITYGATFLISSVLVIRNIESLSFKPKMIFFWMIIKQSYPYALLIIFMTIYTRVDSVMIERMLGDGQEQAGIYAQSFRLLDAFNMIGFMFATLLLPLFFKDAKNEGARSTIITISS